MSYNKLLSSGKIGNLEIKNRVVMTGMMMGVCDPGCHITDKLCKQGSGKRAQDVGDTEFDTQCSRCRS